MKVAANFTKIRAKKLVGPNVFDQDGRERDWT